MELASWKLTHRWPSWMNDDECNHVWCDHICCTGVILGPLTHDRPVFGHMSTAQMVQHFETGTTATLDGLTLRLNQIYWCLGHTENPQISRDTRDIPPKDEQRRCSVFHTQARASWPWSFHQRQGQRVVWSSQWISVLFLFTLISQNSWKATNQAVQKIIKDL